jgi:signal transduction histidine kinase
MGRRRGHERARAYDADGRSASPEVPPLRLRRALAVGEVQRAPGGVVTRVSEGGGCAYLEVGRGPPHRDRFGAFELGATFGTFVAVLAAGLLSYAFTVTPLLRRIEALRRAAVAVGGEAYARGDDDVGDALGEIGRVLDRSHDRLLADRAALIERHHALERHMAELAHDLRTPINAVKGYAEMLIEDADEVGFDAFTFKNLHAVLSQDLMRDPQASGRLRRRSVAVAGVPKRNYS